MDLGTKFKSNFFCSRFLLVFSFFLLDAVIVVGQSSNKLIDFRADDEQLSEVLYRLSDEANLNLTYSSGDETFTTRISYSVSQKQPLLILGDILKNTGYTFKKIGNQIVIFKQPKHTVDKADSDKQNSNQVVTTGNSIKISNSKIDKKNFKNRSDSTFVFITDTIIISDTVFNIVVDTMLIVDTVFVEKETPAVIKDTTTFVKDSNGGWASTLYISPLATNFSLTQKEPSITLRNILFGVDVSREVKRWNFSAGLRLSHFAEKFNHSYTITEGGYFATDTIDEYYTVTQQDTSWYYVTDSSWVDIKTNEYDYNIKNRVGYLSFSLSISYDYYKLDKISLYGRVSASANVLIYKNGTAIKNFNQPNGVDFADLHFSKTIYSILLGAGVRYSLIDDVELVGEVYYLKNLTETVVSFPRNTKISGAGLLIGVKYHF